MKRHLQVPDDETTIYLIGQAQRGDSRALEVLLERVLPPLRRWAHGRLPVQARGMLDTQDIVQDTVATALKKLGDFQPRHQGALQAYLRTALVNRIRDEVRRARARPSQTNLSGDYQDTGPSPLEAAVGSEMLARYENALQRLRTEDREAIVGRVELGLSFEELSGALGKSGANAARLTVRRALMRLAQEMSVESRSRAREDSLSVGREQLRQTDSSPTER